MNNSEYKHPPKWSLKLLKRLIKPGYLEEIEGDMEEVYQDFLETLSPRKARWRYHKEIFQLARPALVRKFSGTQKLNHYGMFRHNILLSLRIFKRYKSSFLINLTGLAAGLASVLMIYLWVQDETNIDRFHEKGDRLYQVMGNFNRPDGISTWNGTSALLGDGLNDAFPEIETAISSTPPEWKIQFELAIDETQLKAVGKHVQAEYFNLFSYPVLMGSAKESLTNPNSVVLTETLATNLFGSPEKAMGQTLKWKSMMLGAESMVTAIIEDIPANSTDQFDLLLPFEAYTKDFGNSWPNPNAITYVLLQEGADLNTVNAKIRNFLDDKLEDNNKELFLTPYEDQYLYGRYENGVIAGGRIEYVRLFSIIAVFILVIACINFMNLATARASRRIKEVGVKKSVGASRAALVLQHLIESVLMALLSLVVAVILVNLFMPQFNLITGKDISLTFSTELFISSLGISLVTGLLAGSYPAFYLSGFKPALVLKGLLKGSNGELWVRRGLVIFQFALTIIFIVGVVVIYQQMEMIQSKQLGFDKDNLVYFEREGKTTDNDNLDGFIKGLKNLPGVASATAINNEFFNPPGLNNFSWEGMTEDAPEFKRFIVYYNFVETADIELLEGRDFSSEFPLRDEWQIIINESAATAIGYEEPVGKKANYGGLDARIVGVVKDFQFKSLHEKTGPAVLMLDPRFLLNTMIRIEAGTTAETLNRLEDYYKVYNPGFTLNYRFLDQDFQALYDAETKVSALSRYFAGLAILISCLGLLGLVAFSAERRTKEIGIRKVLGSDKLSIVMLLSKDFTRMIIIAILIALPVSYYFSAQWLSGFAYPIDLNWWLFAGAGLASLFIAWLAVSFQTLRIAGINPVDCLRDD